MQNVKKLIQEQKVDAIIGPSTTPNALAILDVIAENEVPLMATVGTQSVVEPLDAKRRWVFKTTQNDDLISRALVGHMLKNKVKTRRLHRPERPLRRELGEGVRRPGREGGDQDRRERALFAYRPERDGADAEAPRCASRRGAGRRRRRPGGAAADDAARPGLQGPGLPDARGGDRRLHPSRRRHIFFFAFLPQFVHPGNQAATGHLLGLSLVFMAVTFVVFTVYGYFAAGMRRFVLGRPKVVAFGFK